MFFRSHGRSSGPSLLVFHTLGSSFCYPKTIIRQAVDNCSLASDETDNCGTSAVSEVYNQFEVPYA